MTAIDNQENTVTPICRSLILQHLWLPDQDDAAEQSYVPKNAECREGTDGVINIESNTETLSVDGCLQEARRWLETQCEAEKARTDWTPEHDRETGTAPEDINTSILERIRRGHGPQSSHFEDLLWPLRISGDGEPCPRFSKQPRRETYQSMQEVLMTWNKHIASTCDDTSARLDLIEAMQNRISFLDRASSHRRSADAHDDTWRKLLHIIHAYRPETAEFTTKDPSDLLTIILAHIGFAIPDVDDELKYLMFHTLVAERGYLAHMANAGTRHMLNERIASAKKRGDIDRVAQYGRTLIEWTKGVFEKNCEIISERVQIARENVHLKTLEDFQKLIVLQAAQKMVLKESIASGVLPSDNLKSALTWLNTRETAWNTATERLEKAVEDFDDLGVTCKAAAITTENISDINRTRVLTRALKFAGLDLRDVSETQRQAVVAERLANPGTVAMMGNAIEGITETKTKAQELFDSLGKMDKKLSDMLQAAETVFHEYEALACLIDSNPISVLEDDLVS